MRGAWIEMYDLPTGIYDVRSPPVRGAWIEIRSDISGTHIIESPPVRGAWIEIRTGGTDEQTDDVASREGGVD